MAEPPRPPSPADLPDGAHDAADAATAGLFALLYQELHSLARRFLARERAWHTLQATALVHEAYLHLSRGSTPRWRDEEHFRATAARAIRRVLVNHAESHLAQKRGGGRVQSGDGEALAAAPAPASAVASADVVALDEALSRLDALHERQARIVELRFFAGLAHREIAAELGVSVRTVEADWAMARAWLHGQLAERGDA